MQFSKSILLALVPLFVQVIAYPSGTTTNLVRSNDVNNEAFAITSVKRQDEEDQFEFEVPETEEPEEPEAEESEETSSGLAAQWAQCDGLTYEGPTECAAPYTCHYQNEYYSQCL